MSDYVMDSTQAARLKHCDALRCWVLPAAMDASFTLMLQVVGKQGEPLATCGSVKSDDPQAMDKLRLMIQTWRMAQRFPQGGDPR